MTDAPESASVARHAGDRTPAPALAASDAYYQSRELVRADMAGDLGRAKIVITNFHAFKLRETLELSKGGRALLQGRGPEIEALETDGQMLQRVMPELMGMKDVLVLNDEAHHCYREKARGDEDEEDEEDELKGDDRKEAEKKKERRASGSQGSRRLPGSWACSAWSISRQHPFSCAAPATR